MTRIRRWAGPAAAALLLGPAIWLAALVGARLPATLAVEINVHGLPVPGYSGSSGRALAPLSVRIIADALRDAGSAWATATPKPQPTPSRSSPVPTPTAILPLPTTTATLPLATPSASVLPTPSIAPLPSPSVVPTLPIPTL